MLQQLETLLCCLAVIQFQTFASCKSSPKLQELSYRNFSTSPLLSSNLSWPFTKCYFKWRRFLRVQIKTSNSLFNHVSVLLINKPEVPLPWCNIQSQYFTLSFITLSKTKLESYEPTCFLHIINLILIHEKPQLISLMVDAKPFLLHTTLHF